MSEPAHDQSAGAAIARVSGRCVVVNPQRACGYGLHGGPCRFCRVGTPVSRQDGFPHSIEEVVNAVGEVMTRERLRTVLFATAHFDPADGGIEVLEPYIRAVKRHANILVAAQLHPPLSNRWIDRMYAVGIDAVSFNLEVGDPSFLERYAPGRARYLGRARYHEALRYAARVFAVGTVWSEVVVGAEPKASTRESIDTLVALGVVPVLVRYAPNTEWQAPSLIAAPDAQELLNYGLAATRRTGLRTSWIRGLGYGVAPADLESTNGPGGMSDRLAQTSARTLSRLRRFLRVHRLEDSSDIGRE